MGHPGHIAGAADLFIERDGIVAVPHLERQALKPVPAGDRILVGGAAWPFHDGFADLVRRDADDLDEGNALRGTADIDQQPPLVTTDNVGIGPVFITEKCAVVPDRKTAVRGCSGGCCRSRLNRGGNGF